MGNSNAIFMALSALVAAQDQAAAAATANEVAQPQMILSIQNGLAVGLLTGIGKNETIVNNAEDDASTLGVRVPVTFDPNDTEPIATNLRFALSFEGQDGNSKWVCNGVTMYSGIGNSVGTKITPKALYFAHSSTAGNLGEDVTLFAFDDATILDFGDDFVVGTPTLT